MFENFVIFNEVIKLSQWIYSHLRTVNYTSDNILIPIYQRNDFDSFKQIVDLLQNKLSLVKYCPNLFFCCKDKEKQWLKLIYEIFCEESFEEIHLINGTSGLNYSRHIYLEFNDIETSIDYCSNKCKPRGKLFVMEYIIWNNCETNGGLVKSIWKLLHKIDSIKIINLFVYTGLPHVT